MTHTHACSLHSAGGAQVGGVTHTPAACIILGEPQEDADPHLQYLHAAYITSTFAPL